MVSTFLKRKTSSYLKKNKTLRSNPPYKKADTVGIIFSVEDKPKHDLIKELIKKLEFDGKHVKVISFLPKKKDNHEFLFDFFTDKDFSFWGNVTSHNAASFCETPFDFLFYLDNTPNPLIMNLLARSKAKCRIGKHWENAEPYFELMIDSSESLKGLIDGMYKYASALR